MNIPRQLQGVLWSAPIEKWDLERDKVEIIHRVLRYGSLDDIRWLEDVFDQNEIKNTFINKPIRFYSKQTFNFIKRVVLKINGKLDDKRYVELPL